MKKWLIGSFLLLIFSFLLIIAVYHKTLLRIEKVSIEGNGYIEKDSILAKFPKEIDLFSLNKLRLKELILSNPFIDQVDFKIIYPHSLIIKIKEKNIIATILDRGKKYFMTNKYEFLPTIFNRKIGKVPYIEIGKNLSIFKSLGILDKLSILKSEENNFFQKIVKIDLRNKRKTNIFMKSGREYQFFYNPIFIKDFLKIKVLEEKIHSGKKVLVKGDAITIY